MNGLNKDPDTLLHLLQQRRVNGSLRSLQETYPTIDFSSNDYLGFSSRGLLAEELKTYPVTSVVGSTGSRLISGNSPRFTDVERAIASFHKAEAALIFNSGYDANLGLLSCIPQKGDLILSDELIHASLIDGARLSYATHYKFRHNDIQHLTELINRHDRSYKEIYVVVESVYSMDGDLAPLVELAKICSAPNIHLIVDEAHAIGVFGNKGAGLCDELNVTEACFARIYTYGKAMGCHGAAVSGSKALIDYLINFSRSFIYTTAMSEHGLTAIHAAYQLLSKTSELEKLRSNIRYFNSRKKLGLSFVESTSAIHCKLIPGIKEVQKMEDQCAAHNVFVKSIKSPTVKSGKERLRICLHSFNTKQEIDLLFSLLG